MPSPTTDRARTLRAAGLRVTKQRVAVLEALAEQPHATADAVRTRVLASAGRFSLQAVYDALSALTTAGLVRRIQPAGSSARFELRVADNHHHLVCRSCGEVTDVDCATGEAPCLTPAPTDADPGFVVDEAEVTFWGTCALCAAG